MENSHIEWTNNTYNPIKKKGGGFYCFKVSPACTHCYAETMARRTAAMQGGTFAPYANMKQFPELELRQGMIDGWQHKKKPAMNFVSSMTDVFGEFVPKEWIFKILDGMYAATRQIFQILTKRAERAYYMIMEWIERKGLDMLPANMWIGFSVEDQIRAEERMPWLVKIPAAIRFISCEPLLSLLELTHWLPSINWVICGGESGNKKTIRPMLTDWARSLRDQCISHAVPFFFKQFGEWVEYDQLSQTTKNNLKAGTAKHKIKNYIEKPNMLVHTFHRIGKKISGAVLDGREHKAFPVY